jgi:hypothetical protein
METKTCGTVLQPLLDGSSQSDSAKFEDQRLSYNFLPIYFQWLPEMCFTCAPIPPPSPALYDCLW